MRGLRICSAAILVLASAASAQITDKQQQMHWYYLQKLAIDTKELESCFFNPNEIKGVREAYYRRMDELATLIEDYVAQYSETRGKEESVPAFRYRVWDTTLGVGVNKARPSSELIPALCDTLAK